MVELASREQLRASLLRWLLVLVPGTILLGFLSSALSGSIATNSWFNSLTKPLLYPPPQTFGIVWTILYAMMGYALAIIITARGAWGREKAVIAFGIQLVLNVCWSPLFFAAHQIFGALILILVLDVAVIVTIVLCWRVRPRAAMLLIPYLLWILFATALNYQFYLANPDASGKNSPVAVQRIQL